MRPLRDRLVAALAAVVLLAVGTVVAWGVGGALGLSYSPADVPTEEAVAAPARAATPPPRISVISVPAGQPRLDLAARAVADAIEQRGGPRPAVTAAPASPPGGALTVRLVAQPVGGSPEAYRISGTAVEAADVAGAAYGLYAVADRIRAGAPLPQGEVTPRLGLRLTDAGAVGRAADPADFRPGDDYSLNADIVGDALLPSAPWVDLAAVERIAAEFRQFVDHSLTQGYNGVVVPGFLEYVTFADLGVYPAGDHHVAQAEALSAAFAPVFRYAADMGMRVYFLTDMLAVSPPLERFLGDLDVTDPRLWDVYQAGLTELFDRMPFASGLMVRIGEGGEVYKEAGWDYSSKLAVTTVDAVRAMLRAFLETVGAQGRDVIFRTWTVGVGAVGDLHTNPESYAEVLGGLDDPHLIVSTKYTLGDFYSHLPLNDTLTVGRQRRVVEFQARREFEVFGSLPNDLTGLHQRALQTFLAANPRVEGVWNWTQDGGPLRAGPMTLYLKAGFWQLYDLNTYATGRLAWDPDAPAADITADWIRRTFSDDPATVAAIGQVLALSREAISKGLYIGPYADNTVRALGLEPPPMMWIFEWDIVTGDSAALDSIYAVSRGRVDEAIGDGDRAVALSMRMRDLVAGTDPGTWRDPALLRGFEETLDFQTNLFQVLGAYRAMVLRHAEWLDTGASAARGAWEEATVRYELTRDAHVAAYGGHLDLPAWNFTAADLGATRADRDPAMAWLARVLLALIVLAMVFVSALRPWRLSTMDDSPSRRDRVLVIAVPVAALVLSRLVFTWFAAPAHLLVTLGGWLLFALVARLLVRGRDPFALWAVIGGVALLRSALLMVAIAARGPGQYWFTFWTAPTGRTIYITIAFAAFGWLFVATGLVLRRRYGLSRRRAVAVVLAAAGLALALLAGLVAAIGLERALTVWNDQLALLPWGLSRILGITVYLGIPASLPLYAAGFGLILLAVGGLLTLPRREGRPNSRSGRGFLESCG